MDNTNEQPRDSEHSARERATATENDVRARLERELEQEHHDAVRAAFRDVPDVGDDLPHAAVTEEIPLDEFGARDLETARATFSLDGLGEDIEAGYYMNAKNLRDLAFGLNGDFDQRDYADAELKVEERTFTLRDGTSVSVQLETYLQGGKKRIFLSVGTN